MTSNLTYNEAFTALEALVSQLEEGLIELEALPATIQHANDLISICETKLRATNNAIEAAIKSPTANR